LKWRSCACYCDGKYYLSTRVKYEDGIAENYDEEKNNCLIVYDVNSEKFDVCCDLSIIRMEVYHDEAQDRVAILSGPSRAYLLKTLSKNGLYNGSSISKKIYKTQLRLLFY
jgi:hypothetical protein